MGDEPSRGPVMTRVCWRLVDLLSLILHPDEREVIHGDFAEFGAAGSQALRDVLGLVVRRQAAVGPASPEQSMLSDLPPMSTDRPTWGKRLWSCHSPSFS